MGAYTGLQIVGIILFSIALIFFAIPAAGKILWNAISYPFKVKEYVVAGSIISFEQNKEEIDIYDEVSKTFVDRYFVNIETEDNANCTVSLDIQEYLSLEEKHKEDSRIKVKFFFKKYALIGDEKLQKFEVLEPQIA